MLKRPLTKILGILIIVLMASCATEPDPLDRSEHQAIAKGIFSSDQNWYYNLTVTDTDWGNNYVFIGEQSDTHSGKSPKIKWEITEDRLNGYLVPQVYRGEDGEIIRNEELHQSSLLVSFRIEDHFDIRYRYNSTTREEVPILDTNRDRPWQEREYMKIDWSKNLATNIWAPLATYVESGVLTQESAGFDPPEFWAKGEGDDIAVNPKSWKEGDPKPYAINIDYKEVLHSTLKNVYQLYYGAYMEPTSVRMRHSFLRAKDFAEDSYQPLDYPDEFFRRFGYFRNEYDVYDQKSHTKIESKKKYFALRWDLSGDKKIEYIASPSLQKAIDDGDEQVKKICEDVVSAYNKVLKEATDRQDDVVVFKANERLKDEDGNNLTRSDGTGRWKYEPGDMRYSFINFIYKQSVAQPLGYGPAFPDPDTGKIITATVHIYAGWAEWVIQRALDQYDVVAGNCSLEDIKAGRHFNEQSGKCDRGPIGPAEDGPVANSGISALVQDSPHALASGMMQSPKNETLWNQMMTPALKTAYFPKAGLKSVKNLVQFKQNLVADLPNIKALHLDSVRHPSKLNLDAFRSISGTSVESLLLPSNNLRSLMPFATSSSDPDVVSQLSPAARLNSKALEEARHDHSRHGFCLDQPTMFEPSINAFVQEMKDKPRNEVEKTLREWVYYTTTLHEMGHTLGLRHNFAASADRRNYSEGYEDAYKKYWDQVEALRTEYSDRIHNGDAQAYEEYVRKVDALPSTHDRFASSSIMDYVGDWVDWTKSVRSYDRGALLFAYGKKVEVEQGAKYVVKPYKEGDFDIEYHFDFDQVAKSGRRVRYYLFCSDEKVYDDVFCTRFDRGSTATEIVRNFIKTAQNAYLFTNFKRDRSGFEGARRSYYMNKWLRGYYMYAKAFTQISINNMRYEEFWGSLFNGISAIGAGPESRNMIPGYLRNGGEDLLRASLLYYYFLMYDVLMRPDYGHFVLRRDDIGEQFWENSDQKYIGKNDISVFVPAGVGWGFSDRWDVQQDPTTYYEFLKRTGVELDKTIALEILSIPAALNTPLYYEKANGTSYWNSLWTNNGSQLWKVIRGMITDNFSHTQNPWCMKCDAECKADPINHPPQLEVQPIDYLEGLGEGGLLTNYSLPQGKNRCGADSYPVKPGMDALFAIKPIFYSIAGASHPWYHNSLAERLDSQIKGGNHRFDIPEGATYAEFINPSGTKTYQAVQTKDGLSISYALVDKGRKISNRLALVEACLAGEDTLALEGKIGTFDRSCIEIKTSCYESETRDDFCDAEGWDSSFTLDALKYRDLDRIEAMLIMMQDMINIAGHYAWRVPGYLSE